MITITKFPVEKCNLGEISDMLKVTSASLTIRWQYTDEGELNVNLKVEAPTVGYKIGFESALSSWLSAHSYVYTIVDDVQCASDGPNWYTLRPRSCQYATNNLSETAVYNLCVSMLRHRGSFVVTLVSQQKKIKASVMYFLGERPGAERIFSDLEIIFPDLSNTWKTPIEYFDFAPEYNYLLTLPYSTENTISILNGYGGSDKVCMPSGDSNSTITLGRIHSDPLNRSLCITKDNLQSSFFVGGAPGYGKSTLLRSVVYQAWKKLGIPSLIIEPKKEYRELQKLLGEDFAIVESLTGYNPLLPPLGCSYSAYSDILLELMNVVSPLRDSTAIEGYIRETYLTAMRMKKHHPREFLEVYDAIMRKHAFVGESLNFVKAGRARLMNLFRLFMGPNFEIVPYKELNIEKLLAKPCVLECGDLATPKAISAFTYFVMSHVDLVFKKRQNKDITNMLIIEEAHSVLDAHIDESVKSRIKNMIAEGRARGLTVVICDQSPQRVDFSATSLCGNTIALRLVSGCDKEFIAEQLACTPDELNTLRKATACVRTNRSYAPVTISIDVPDEILDL